MQEFKLDIINREVPGKVIDFVTLNVQDSQWIFRIVFHFLGLKNVSNTQELFHTLDAMLNNIHHYKNDVKAEIISNIISDTGILDDSLVFVIWDLESKVDCFRFSELLNHFEFVWYPGSDEAILLFFPSVEKFIMITDHGYILEN